MNRQRLWVIGSVVLTIAILVLGWFLAISPVLGAAATANSQRADVDAENVKQEQVLAQLKLDFENIDELRAERAKLELAIPSDESLDLFLDELSSLAGASGVTVVTVAGATPSPFVAREGLEVSLVDGTNLLSLPVTLTVTGSSQQVFDFLSRLQQAERLFVPDALGLAVVTGTSTTGADGKPVPSSGTVITASIAGLAYVLLDPARPAGAPVPICGTDEAKAADEASTAPVECQPPYAPNGGDPFTPLVAAQ